MEVPSFVDMTVSAVILTIAYIIATKTLPNAFERIMEEFKAKREEFLQALESERTVRAADRRLHQEFIRSERESFIKALSDERMDHAKLREEQNKLLAQAIDRLQTHLDMCLVQISSRVGDLSSVVNKLVEKEYGRSTGKPVDQNPTKKE